MFTPNRTPSSSLTYNPATTKYYVNFAGKTIETTVTDKAATADAWVLKILSLHAHKPTVVGLDIESPPKMSNICATLQLCVGDKCLILQLLYTDEIPPSRLKAFLADPNFTFVGVEVADDVEKLRKQCGLECRNTADLRDVAIGRWPGRFPQPSLKNLAAEVVGLYMEKPKNVCRSYWDKRVLDEDQIQYACIDAYASYRIGHKLLGKLNLVKVSIHFMKISIHLMFSFIFYFIYLHLVGFTIYFIYTSLMEE